MVKQYLMDWALCSCKMNVAVRSILADDTQIYLHAFPSKLDDALGIVERYAQAIADWDMNNGLDLNRRKL